MTEADRKRALECLDTIITDRFYSTGMIIPAEQRCYDCIRAALQPAKEGFKWVQIPIGEINQPHKEG